MLSRKPAHLPFAIAFHPTLAAQLGQQAGDDRLLAVLSGHLPSIDRRHSVAASAMYRQRLPLRKARERPLGIVQLLRIRISANLDRARLQGNRRIRRKFARHPVTAVHVNEVFAWALADRRTEGRAGDVKIGRSVDGLEELPCSLGGWVQTSTRNVCSSAESSDIASLVLTSSMPRRCFTRERKQNTGAQSRSAGPQ